MKRPTIVLEIPDTSAVIDCPSDNARIEIQIDRNAKEIRVLIMTQEGETDSDWKEHEITAPIIKA